MRRPSTAQLVTALVASAVSTAALSDTDIASVFGRDATGLTGGSIQLPQFLYSIVTNSTHALVTLNATSSAPSSVGWMATALGTAMINGDFLITWPTVASSAVTWTLSHRKTAGGEYMPTLASTDAASSTAALFKLVPSMSTSEASSPYTAVTYTRELTFPSTLSGTEFKPLTRSTNQILYSSSTVGPGSTDEAATLQQHDQAHAATTIDVSTAITLSSSTDSSTPGNSAGVPMAAGLSYNKRDMQIMAHASLGSIAFLILMPIGAFIGRYMRHTKWFPAHAAVQLLAAILVIAAFALGIVVTGSPHFTDTHTRLGLALFILVIVQVVGGALAHTRHHDRAAHAHSVVPTLAGDHPIRLAHILLGIALVVLGFYQVHEGFGEWVGENTLGKPVPKAVKVVFWVWLAIVAVVYLAGWALEIVGVKKRKATYGNGVEKVSSY